MKALLFTLTLIAGLSAYAKFDLGDIIDAVETAQGRGGPGFDQGRPGWGQPGRPGRPGPGRPPGHGRVTCSATDRGWEEHWGGHRSCEECVRKHGRCVESCKEEMYRCTVEGTPRNAPQGTRDLYYGMGSSQWEAQDDAMRNCQWRGYSCVTRGCEANSREVSRRNCN